ncbi:hypothetical protein AVEN_226742-1 [Araneus ventricosus]|uniref:Uncharacterized protein n=1 Tax=Araneus ventricosus TaxID=182803 RepID=A0A4Y2VUF9_ARAVE|nr:hypothetical protein AVEN_226742-1 [Araneus ventricosus]
MLTNVFRDQSLSSSNTLERMHGLFVENITESLLVETVLLINGLRICLHCDNQLQFLWRKLNIIHQMNGNEIWFRVVAGFLMWCDMLINGGTHLQMIQKESMEVYQLRGLMLSKILQSFTLLLENV